jgi:hypothetical protein
LPLLRFVFHCAVRRIVCVPIPCSAIRNIQWCAVPCCAVLCCTVLQPPELHPYNFPELLVAPLSPITEHDHQVGVAHKKPLCLGPQGCVLCLALN